MSLVLSYRKPVPAFPTRETLPTSDAPHLMVELPESGGAEFRAFGPRVEGHAILANSVAWGRGGPGSKVRAGTGGVAILMDGGRARAGNYGLAKAGNKGAAMAGKHGVAVATVGGVAVSDEYGVSVGGDGSMKVVVGDNGVAVQFNAMGQCSGGHEAILVWPATGTVRRVGLDSDWEGREILPNVVYELTVRGDVVRAEEPTRG